MPLLIETPDTRAPERDYILSVILGEFLGLDWQCVPSDRKDVRITMQGHQGDIRMPDILLQTLDADWLTPQSLPSQPLPVWDSRELGLDITLVDQHLPIIYGDHQFLKINNNSLSSLDLGPSASGFASTPLNTLRGLLRDLPMRGMGCGLKKIFWHWKPFGHEKHKRA